MAAPEEPEALARTARRRSRAVSPRAHAEPQTAPRAPSSSQRKRQEPGGDLRGPSSQCADRIEPASRKRRAHSDPRFPAGTRGLHLNEDGYLDGAIVRVALKNFVTYDSVEVRPGPNLNMIIGPNGTGKSTIVCAIALGLGGGTNLLARAREISDFVKHGRDRASIEIELRHHDCNIVIKRSISRKNNTSSWAVNGKPSSHKAVLATVSELNVQVDNLCQFLPQDRVSDFAQMSPAQLLVETQKAAGEMKLSSQHQELIGCRQDLKRLEATANAEREQIQLLEQRNAISQRDVELYEERERIANELRILGCALPWVNFKESRQEYNAAKALKAEAIEAHQRMLALHRPMEDTQKMLKARLNEIEQEKKDSTADYTAKARQFVLQAKSVEELEGNSMQLRRELKQVKKEQQQREIKIAKTREEIAKLEEEVQVDPPRHELETIRHRMDETTGKLSRIHSNLMELQDRQRSLIDDRQRAVRLKDEAQKRLDELQDVRERRLRALNDADTYKATQWVRANRNLFREAVFDPSGLEISIKDPKYMDAIENSIGRASRQLFVAQNREDYLTLTRELNDKQRLRVNVVQNSGMQYSALQPRVRREELQKFGFEGYLIDLIEGPEPVLLALCLRDNLHTVPFASGLVDNVAVEQSRLFIGYIANQTKYNIKFSRYGQRLSSTRAQRLFPARFFNGTDNTEDRASLEKEVRGFDLEIGRLDDEISKLEHEDRDMRRKDTELRHVREELTREKNDVQRQIKDHERKKAKLGICKQDLEALETAASATERQAAIRRELHVLLLKRSRAVQRFKTALIESTEVFRRRARLHLLQVQASHDAVVYKRECERTAEDLRETHNHAIQVQRRARELKAEVQRLSNIARQKTQSLDQEQTRKVSEYSEAHSSLELEAMIEAARSRLDSTGEVDQSVLRKYHENLAAIDAAKKKIADYDAALARSKQRIDHIKSLWYPQLKDLVARISEGFTAAFERINCVGEVRLSEHDDFADWGIEILVKFRDHERLQVLTGQRQSGGERSVSTVLYLMSMQELARAPFRVVDEINQGMDPRNERLVHSQMVEIACRPNTSQYFLITPKLLPDLEYHPRMKVLCIYSGDWQPFEFNIKGYINEQRAAISAQ